MTYHGKPYGEEHQSWHEVVRQGHAKLPKSKRLPHISTIKLNTAVGIDLVQLGYDFGREGGISAAGLRCNRLL